MNVINVCVYALFVCVCWNNTLDQYSVHPNITQMGVTSQRLIQEQNQQTALENVQHQ